MCVVGICEGECLWMCVWGCECVCMCECERVCVCVSELVCMCMCDCEGECVWMCTCPCFLLIGKSFVGYAPKKGIEAKQWPRFESQVICCKTTFANKIQISKIVTDNAGFVLRK